MTPLAQQLMGELLLPQHKQRIVGHAPRIAFPVALTEFKFFDMRKVFDPIPEGARFLDLEDTFPPTITEEVRRFEKFKGTLCFLPAPHCWFEIEDEVAVLLTSFNDYRHGMFIVLKRKNALLVENVATLVTIEDRSGWNIIPHNKTHKRLTSENTIEDADKLITSVVSWAAVSLVCINSAHVATRTIFMPGERERQKSLRGKSLVGKFPLRAWTEITLVPGTTHIPDPQHSATTGERAQHFVRAHLRRYRSGKVVTVKAHHRGNPAIGMVQTRYNVEKPNG